MFPASIGDIFHCVNSLKMLTLHLSAHDTGKGSIMAVTSTTLKTCTSPVTDIKLVSKQLLPTDGLEEQRDNAPHRHLKVRLLASSQRAAPEPFSSHAQAVSQLSEQALVPPACAYWWYACLHLSKWFMYLSNVVALRYM